MYGLRHGSWTEPGFEPGSLRSKATDERRRTRTRSRRGIEPGLRESGSRKNFRRTRAGIEPRSRQSKIFSTTQKFQGGCLGEIVCQMKGSMFRPRIWLQEPTPKSTVWRGSRPPLHTGAADTMYTHNKKTFARRLPPPRNKLSAPSARPHQPFANFRNTSVIIHTFV